MTEQEEQKLNQLLKESYDEHVECLIEEISNERAAFLRGHLKCLQSIMWWLENKSNPVARID